ncbi:MAG: hypothetical protein N3A69_12355, partial [Leptospiraceae bacterium]|nr:hypothetical protein [Leptospiraceae bacterium]
IMGVDGVYHVVSKDVKIVNQLLENLREETPTTYNAKNYEEKLKIYKEREKYFNSLLFPDKRDYEIIRIPTLPYPRDYLARVITATLQDLESLSNDEKLLLEAHGILEKLGRKFKLTDYGKRFMEVLLGR